jgi:hypothetical protein
MAKKRYTVVPTNAFDALQVDAGVLLKNFDIDAAIESVDNPGFTDADLICATTGGVNPSCVANYSDYGEDVDNVPNNMMEFKNLDSWDCKLTTTGLGTSPELIRLSLGAADIDLTDTGKIVPRRDLKQTDFSDLWWVGDKANGGFVAIQLINALSTGGFSLQTTKNGKGQVGLEFTGHVSIKAQDVVPMVCYSYDPAEEGGGDTPTPTPDPEPTPTTYSVTQDLTNVTSTFEGSTVEAEASLNATLTADSGYEIASVEVTMGGTDITETAYTAATGAIAIASVTGDVVITAIGSEQ